MQDQALGTWIRTTSFRTPPRPQIRSPKRRDPGQRGRPGSLLGVPGGLLRSALRAQCGANPSNRHRSAVAAVAAARRPFVLNSSFQNDDRRPRGPCAIQHVENGCVHRGCAVYAAISGCQAGHKGTAPGHSQCEIARRRITSGCYGQSAASDDTLTCHLLRASRAMGFVGMRLLGGFPTLTPPSSWLTLTATALWPPRPSRSGFLRVWHRL
jgi:hypothetical protein